MPIPGVSEDLSDKLRRMCLGIASAAIVGCGGIDWGAPSTSYWRLDEVAGNEVPATIPYETVDGIDAGGNWPNKLINGRLRLYEIDNVDFVDVEGAYETHAGVAVSFATNYIVQGDLRRGADLSGYLYDQNPPLSDRHFLFIVDDRLGLQIEGLSVGSYESKIVGRMVTQGGVTTEVWYASTPFVLNFVTGVDE